MKTNTPKSGATKGKTNVTRPTFSRNARRPVKVVDKQNVKTKNPKSGAISLRRKTNVATTPFLSIARRPVDVELVGLF